MHALRRSELAVSPAETLDAMHTLAIVGVEDRQFLKESLAIVLAKSTEEKVSFEQCFNRFFSLAFNQDALDNQLPAPSKVAMVPVKAKSGGDSLDQASTSQPAQPDSSTEALSKRQALMRRLSHRQSPLTDLLITADWDGLMVEMIRAAGVVRLDQIKTLRERSIYVNRILRHMGTAKLAADIEVFRQSTDPAVKYLALWLEDMRLILEDRVKTYVETRYLLLVDGSGNRFLREAVSAAPLTAMQAHYFDHIRDAVSRMARRLIKKHSRQRKTVRKGKLDIRRTLRKNIAYDGTLFDLKWRKLKKHPPKIFVLCDVSGSVKTASRFLLTFLYSIREIFPEVRAFAFSSDIGEVTELFLQYPLEEAVEMTLDDYGRGSTDYGEAFAGFAERCLQDLDSRSTIIVLGDGRNNYYYNGARELARLSQRCRQLIWLNPEPRSQWKEGDSEMPVYLAHCDFSAVCNSLEDLERITGKVLENAS